jgi:FkbM family methyltransferase
MFHNPETSPSIPFEVSFFGMRYPGNLNNYIDWSVFFYGAYTRHELYVLRDLAAALKEKQVSPFHFYDIGANIGHHTLFMAPRVDKVFAFEPFEGVRTKIRDKIERNNLDNVVVFPIGLSDADAELDFYEPNGANTGTGSFVAREKNSHGNVRKLSVRKGDSFFESHSLPAVNLLKIDVEGFEIPVLRGLRQRLRQNRPVILMEVSAATRAEMGTEEEFRKHLYQDAHIFEVASISISSSYRLRQFRFATSEEILVVPEEKLATVRDVLL